MARPLRIEYPGAFYHVTSRGNEKGKIFISDGDRKKLLTYLENAFLKFKVVIHAYCFMVNHYHLLMETPLGNLSRSMHYLNSSYTSYYNIKRQRTGHLFQGRYKALLVDRDSYIQSLSSYIHLNPVRAKIVQFPEEYPWSSYKYYISSQKTPCFLNTKLTLSYFGGRKNSYKEYVNEGLLGTVENPLKNIKAGFILGDENFVSQIREKYATSVKETRDLPSLRKLNKLYVSPEVIVDIIERNTSLSNKEKLKYKVYFLRRYTDETLRETANRCGGDYVNISSLSQIVSRLDKKREEDRKINRLVQELENKIVNV